MPSYTQATAWSDAGKSSLVHWLYTIVDSHTSSTDVRVKNQENLPTIPGSYTGLQHGEWLKVWAVGVCIFHDGASSLKTQVEQ